MAKLGCVLILEVRWEMQAEFPYERWKLAESAFHAILGSARHKRSCKHGGGESSKMQWNQAHGEEKKWEAHTVFGKYLGLKAETIEQHIVICKNVELWLS